RRLLLLNTVAGIRRLNRQVPTSTRLAMAAIDGMTPGVLLRDVINAAANHLLDEHRRKSGDIRDAAAFAELLEHAHTHLTDQASRLLTLAGPALIEASTVAATLDRLEISPTAGVG